MNQTSANYEYGLEKKITGDNTFLRKLDFVDVTKDPVRPELSS